MDCSPEYIKMCEPAKEIQEHAPQAGDYYRNGNEDIVILPMSNHIHDFCTYECLYLVGAEDIIWLPRQDQLQEMVMPCINSETIAYYLSAVKNFNEPSRKFKTMEQLWLAFVMKEKFGKVWNGEDWIERK